MGTPVRVKSLEHLIQLADDRRSVVVPGHSCYNHRHPAAWVQNLPGRMLHSLLTRGMFVYQLKNKRRLRNLHPEDESQ